MLVEHREAQGEQKGDLFRVGDCLADMFALLSSSDVLRCGSSCRAVATLVHSEVDAVCKILSGHGGIHRTNDVWLHTIATAAEISRYMIKTSNVSISGALHFNASVDMTAYELALEYCRHHSWKDWPYNGSKDLEKKNEGAHLFAQDFFFDTASVQSLLRDSSGPEFVRSTSSLQLQWDESFRAVCFSVRLVMRRAGDGVFAFLWEVLAGGLLIQDLDLLEVCVRGCLKSVSNETGNMQPLQVSTFKGFCAQSGVSEGLSFVDSSDAAFQVIGEDYITEKSAFFDALLAGEPMTGIVRFEAACMGVNLPLACATEC